MGIKAVVNGTVLSNAAGGIEVGDSASIAVRDQGSDALVSTWTDRAGTTSGSNPVTADADGEFEFYVTPGYYKVEVTYDGDTRTLNNMPLLAHALPEISSGDAGKVPKVNSAEDGFDLDDKVPRKDEANAFTQDQRIDKGGALLNFGASDGSDAGPLGIQVYSNSFTPAMAFVYRNGTETWNIENNIGTVQMRFYRAGGVTIGSPTGGSKGAGTLNAEAVYDDNSLLTQHVLLAYLNGVVDTDAADADVPDRVRTVQEAEPERWVPETRRVERVVEEHDPARGRVVRKRVQRDEPVVDTVPVVDEAGEPTEEVRRVQRMRRVPAREEVTEVEPRRHEPMHAFAAENPGLEEFDPALFWQRVERDGELPAIRRALEAGRTSTGALLQALMETAEVQAVHIHQLEQRIKALEEGR